MQLDIILPGGIFIGKSLNIKKWRRTEAWIKTFNNWNWNKNSSYEFYE